MPETPEVTPETPEVTPETVPETVPETPEVTPETVPETPEVTPETVPETVPETPEVTFFSVPVTFFVTCFTPEVTLFRPLERAADALVPEVAPAVVTLPAAAAPLAAPAGEREERLGLVLAARSPPRRRPGRSAGLPTEPAGPPGGELRADGAL